MLFGRKSEKVLYQIEQLKLQFEDLVVASAIEELQAVALKKRPVQAKPLRRPLPREVHKHMPGHKASPTVAVVSVSRAKMCRDAGVREYVRSSFKVLRHVRPKLSCDACDRILHK